MALAHVGADTAVASISPPDGSIEAGHCARFYPLARAEMLEDHTWTWGKARAALAETTNASDVWGYAYVLPSDCLSPVRVLQQAVFYDFVVQPYPTAVSADEMQQWTERGSADFEVEGQVLYTHEPDAVLLYTRDITDTTKFSMKSVVALSYLLASYLAGPIIKGEPGATAAAKFRQAYDVKKGSAAAGDANGSSERAEHIPDFIRVR
jgi:hypothetical protein